MLIGIIAIVGIVISVILMFSLAIGIIADPVGHGFVDVWGGYIVAILLIVLAFFVIALGGMIVLILV